MPLDEAAIKELWRSKGIHNARTLSFMVKGARIRRVYRDPKVFEERLEALKKAVPFINPVTLVNTAPSILQYSNIPSKLESLAALFQPGDLIRLLTYDSAILTRESNHVVQKMEQLQELFPGINVAKMVSKAPNLLSFQVYPALESKLNQLQSLLPSIDVAKVIAMAPTILYHDITNSIRLKIQSLSVLLPTCDIGRLVTAVPALLCSDIEGTVASKLGWIRNNVQDPAAFDKKIVANPRLLVCGYGVIFGRIEFYRKTNGLIPVNKLRAILMASVSTFERDYPTYREFLVKQLTNLGVSTSSEQSVGSLEKVLGTKYLSLVNK